MSKPRSYWLEKLDKARHELVETEKCLKKSGKKVEEAGISPQLRRKLKVEGGLMGRQLWHRRVEDCEKGRRKLAYLNRRRLNISRRIEFLQQRIEEVQTPTWHDILKRGSLRI